MATDGEYQPNYPAANAMPQNDGAKAPLVVVIPADQVNQQHSVGSAPANYSAGYAAGYAAAQPYQQYPPPPGHPGHPGQPPYGPLYDDPTSVWMFLILGFFFPICCCVGLCASDPNRGPRTQAAYNTLRTCTIIYWVFFAVLMLIIIITASSQVNN